jgi:hypothetical protein
VATNFPTSLDSLTNPSSGDSLTSPSHAGQHADANDAIEALQAKVGVNSSAVTTSLDYKVENLLAVSQSNRNVVINGAMQVAQRGTSVTGITSGGYRTADRYAFDVATMGTWTQTVENDAPTGSGFRKSLKLLCTTADASPAAGDYLILQYYAEGQNVQQFLKGTSSAKQFTLSFWVKSNVTGTYIAEIVDNDNSRRVSASYSVSASATWEKKTITFPADTTGAFDNDNAASLGVFWWLGAGSTFTGGSPLQTTWGTATNTRATGVTNLAAATNNYWQITGVQLEPGAVATPFEFEHFDVTLRRCMRYFEKSFDYGTAPAHNTGGLALHNNCGSLGCGGNTYLRLAYQVQKRAAPTMRAYDPGASHTATENWWRSFSSCTGTAVQNAIAMTFYESFADGYLAYATGAGFGFHYTLDAEL